MAEQSMAFSAGDEGDGVDGLQAQGGRVNQLKAACCERLAWDSGFFGVEIARVLTGHLSSDVVTEADRFCRINSIDCLYFLAESADKPSIRLAEEAQFDLVDIRVTLARSLRMEAMSSQVPQDSRIRIAVPDDLDHLRSVAAHSYHDSRFYFDGRFPTEKCDRLYETWLEKSFASHAGMVLVAEWQGNPAGYITCEKSDAGAGQIGLLGVDAAAQGVGLGRALVNSAVTLFQQWGLDQAYVATQGRNIGAQAVYQRCGFTTSSVQLWYHRWFNTSAG